MVPCKLCQQNKEPNKSQECAFTNPKKRFSDVNHNCATLNKLREIAQEQIGVTYGNDESLFSIADKDGGFIILGCYKNRGKVDFAFYITESCPFPLSEKAALRVIDQYKKEN